MDSSDLFEEFERELATKLECAMAGQIKCQGKVRVRSFMGEGILLCEAHMNVLCSWRNEQTARDVAEIYEAELVTEHTAGETYCIRDRDGLVKIGMTSKGDLSRLVNLSKRSNGGEPVEVLAILPGGRSRELLTHHLWKHRRVIDKTERFNPDPEMTAWIEKQGIPPEYKSWVEDYETRMERKAARCTR
ncbi:hypothetical protein [Streptomyces parvus]|uniref:hypothetical protein n=2 Tax=Streptomyces parvus TaxID=66428 RepID=UPI00344BCAAF